METVKRLRKYPKIEIVSHLINGLPGETHEMMVENVRRCVTDNDIQGIKLHLLHLMTNTRMQRDYHEGRLQLMSQDEYVRVICDQLEIIPKHIVIHRITGDAPRDMLLGLMWSLNKWEARTRALVQYFIDKGVQGLYVNGSSGECIYQSVEDRKLILEEVMAVAKGKLTIIAHVACNNTKDSMELARHAESLGVDAIATIPPIYFRLPEYSVAKYWNDISSAAPNTDYVIYNIPQLAGVALTSSLYTEMLKNPRVIGVKNSSMPVQDIQTFVSLGGEDHIVFNGPDEQFLGGRLMGAKAGIGGTYGAMPELFLKLNQLIADKDLETARELQYAINAIIGKLTAAHGNMYGVIKEVLKINEDLNIGSVRSPLTPVTEDDRPVVEEAAALIRETKERFL
ncbi:N-acetylneuraminate lyase [Streptococcus pneumoniae]|nr:N-acetylneuraminate lyase [Streptococcus pneumoniae]